MYADDDGNEKAKCNHSLNQLMAKTEPSAFAVNSSTIEQDQSASYSEGNQVKKHIHPTA